MKLRILLKLQSIAVALLMVLSCISGPAFSQGRPAGSTARQSQRIESHSNRPRIEMSAETRELMEQAVEKVCTEQRLDPLASMPIDEMQARPSMPVDAPEAQAGLARARRVLPIARALVISSLKELATEYGFDRSGSFRSRIQKAIRRVQTVKHIKPDMESRDNASVFLTQPDTITFGTLFLAGLRSDEGMISVLAHELMHIADGSADSLRSLVSAVARRASSITGMDIHGQRGEELACDLIGAMAVRSYVADTPSYESITRRLARSVQHNCVELDEGDEDHLSPRSTIKALLLIHPRLMRELVNNQHEPRKIKTPANN